MGVKRSSTSAAGMRIHNYWETRNDVFSAGKYLFKFNNKDVRKNFHRVFTHWVITLKI